MIPSQWLQRIGGTQSGRSTATGTPRTATGTSTPIRLRIRTRGTPTTSSSPATQFFSSGKPEVFVSSPFLQPPTILPMLSTASPIVVNCLEGMSFSSQQSWMKNLNESILPKESLSKEILFSIEEKDARCKMSKRSVKSKSTLCPNPKRSHLGKFRSIATQSL